MTTRRSNNNIDLSTSTSTNTSDCFYSNFTKSVIGTTRGYSGRNNFTTINNNRNTTTSTVTIDSNVIIGAIVITRTRRIDNYTINLTSNRPDWDSTWNPAYETDATRLNWSRGEKRLRGSLVCTTFGLRTWPTSRSSRRFTRTSPCTSTCWTPATE